MENQETTSAAPTEAIISVGMLDQRVIEKPAPVYPDLVKRAGLGGRAVVEVLIDHSGQVEFAQAISGHPVLYPAILAAAKQARFWPTLVNGLPVKVSGFLSYELERS